MDKKDKKLREEFSKLIEETRITDDSTKEEIEKELEKISNWIIKNIPEKLYRYRSCAEYNIKSLENDEIWGSSLINLNDSFEGLLNLDLTRIENDVKELFSEEGIKNCLENLEKNGYSDRYGNMLSLEVKKEFEENLMKNIKNKDKTIKMAKEIYELNKKEYIAYLNNLIGRIIEGIYRNFNIYRNIRKIACFSTDYKSMLMWGHYADGHKGFVAEYNMKEIIKKCKFECNVEQLKNCSKLGLDFLLVPVIYRENSYDGTDYLLQNIVYHILQNAYSSEKVSYFDHDKLFALRLILNKSKDWEYEKEWRLVANIKSEIELGVPECILKCRPKKVLLGAKMKIEDKKRIINICKEKNIEYDEMQNNIFSKKYIVETKSNLEKNNKSLIKI